ncbi:MAG: phenylalanine--tRNA ligase subunit beta [Candidatus Bathyarchaeota archaeon]
MPTIEFNYTDFEQMLGLKLHKNLNRLNELLALVKGEVKRFDTDEGVLNVEIKDTNRPDIWNVEGLVRTLHGFLGKEKGIKKYDTGPSIIDVYVDSKLRKIRPYIGCTIIENCPLTDVIIRGLMQLQEKLDESYGRNRQRTSIGLYDMRNIEPPLHYTVAEPTEVSFAPLGFKNKMNLDEILQNHPKGIEYGNIINKHSEYPVLLDSNKKVLSFPPIINSNDLGRITEETKQILVEVTGTLHETVLDTLNIVTLSLIDRGGKAHSVTVHYPHEHLKVTTPRFKARSMVLEVSFVQKIIGIKLKTEEIVKLLNKARFAVQKLDKHKMKVIIPCYRTDVMHPVDLVEDVAISYGYNNITPLWRHRPTTGNFLQGHNTLTISRDLMIGLGYQEVLTYTLTNPNTLFDKMNIPKQRIIKISNPKIQNLTCLRNQLLPSLLEFLGNNLHIQYPQKIFELGIVTVPDDKSETKTKETESLAAITTHSQANFSEVMSALDAFFTNFGLKQQIKEITHPSFIKGRVGALVINGKEVGVLGEIHPKVLEAWELENPTAAFELNLHEIITMKKTKHRLS